MTAATSPEALANTVQLLRGYHKGSFLIVEGGPDARAYAKQIDASLCCLQPGFGKPSVLEAVALLEKRGIRGVLGIVDRDFERFIGGPRSETLPNIFVTDSHDLEMEMLRTSAFESVNLEYADPDGLRSFEKEFSTPCRDRILAAARDVGMLRLLSLRGGWGINFDALTFSHFIDATTLTARRDLLLADAVTGTKLDAREVQNRYYGEVDKPYDLNQLCKGRDAIRVWTIGLRDKFGTRQARRVDEGEIARALRLSYTPDLFKRTALFDSLRGWEQDNRPFRIFP